MDVAGHGANQQAIVNSLSGTGSATGSVGTLNAPTLPGATAAMVAAWAVGLVLRDLRSLALQLHTTRDVLAGQAEWRAEHAVVTTRCNHYLRGPAYEPLPDQPGLGGHTDYGMVTLLVADPVPGLQVLRGDTWHDATWDKAFAEIEARLLPIIERDGRDAEAIYGFGRVVFNHGV